MQELTVEAVQAIFGNAADFTVREIESGGNTLYAVFLDGLTSGGDIAELVIRPLCEITEPTGMAEVLDRAKRTVWCASMKSARTPDEIAQELVNGSCAVIFPGQQESLCFEVKTGEKRSPEAPESENTVKGAKDAFTETLRTNTSLVRRHLRTSALRISAQTVGSRTLTGVSICWIEGLTNEEYVKRMQERLSSIDIDGLLSPSAVEESVTGSRRTAFPLLQYTERTDAFCQGLLSGQVGLLADGLPLGYLAPVRLAKLMESPEDRAVDYVSASCLRVLRYAALFLSLLLPALYAAMAMYHQQMLPTKLLLAIIESKQNVPFPTILEVLGLLAAFELLQEAGLHLPQAIGTAVSIIGGLVVGTAAVEADLVSPAALIVAAASGICGFTLPSRDLSDAIRIWRFVLTVFAGLAGLFGVTVGFILLVIHLAGLRSLDVAYLDPFSEAKIGGALSRPRLMLRKSGDGMPRMKNEGKQAKN